MATKPFGKLWIEREELEEFTKLFKQAGKLLDEHGDESLAKECKQQVLLIDEYYFASRKFLTEQVHVQK